MTTQTGTIEQWNEEKAFGFIRSEKGGERVFFHINDVNRRAGRPRVGAPTEFQLSSDDSGRRCAVAVSCKKSLLGGDIFRRGFLLPKVVAGTFLAVVIGSSLLGYVPHILALWYLVASAVAFVTYVQDKKAALQDRRRAPENALQLWALLGGWPGALVAQTKLRHKTKKVSFRVVFWTMSLMNVAVFGWLHTTDGAFLIEKVITIFRSLADLA